MRAKPWPMLTLLARFATESAQSQTEETRLAFVSLDGAQATPASGTLRPPPSDKPKLPAIVIVHGTGRIDERGAFHIEKLAAAGMPSFEVDFKTGMFNGPRDRPPNDSFLPLVFAGLKLLRRQPRIDADRIATMGFSLGGQLSLTAALQTNRQRWLGEEKSFAAHAAFYPGSGTSCRSWQKAHPPRAPIIVFFGKKDAYGDGQASPEVKQAFADRYQFDVTMIAYPDTYHGFDRQAPASSFADPAAIGGRAYIQWNQAAAMDARSRAVSFLLQALQ